MAIGLGTTIASHFGSLKDPRIDRTKQHKLLDIVTIAICGTICGADGWVDIEEFGKSKEEWFWSFLELPNGIPSHDTFGRVFSLLDPKQFQRCFQSWVQAINEVTAGQIIAIDGKTLRRSHDRQAGRSAIHMVSAWAEANSLVLGQVKVEDKSNEITAIPVLLDTLVLAGCIVTIDAAGTQTAIAQQIVDAGADYVLAVKENQPTLYKGVQWLFSRIDHPDYPDLLHDSLRTTDEAHGRSEIRHYYTITDPARLRALDPEGRWPNLKSVGMVRSQRREGRKHSDEMRYFISTLDGTVANFAHAARRHWSIENKLHWVLDIAFREDDSRVRMGAAQANLAVLRHIALNLLNRERSTKRGVKGKRLKAGWDNAYLLKVLNAYL